jgi:hypothetical protein
VSQGGCLVSIAARLSTLAVPGGEHALCLIKPLKLEVAFGKTRIGRDDKN